MRHQHLVLALSALVSVSGRVSAQGGGSIVDLLRQGSDVEAALALLPRSYFASGVPVFSSGSLQEASFDKPRILMASPQADVMIAYNDASMAGGHKIEVIEVHDREFQFFDLDYAAPPPVVRQNPEECGQCHRYKARPNFEHYFLWPGMYGADDGNFGPPAEFDRYAGFLARITAEKAAGHGRYRFLPPTPAPDQPTDFSAFKGRMALPFNIALSRRNAERIVRELEATPGIAPFRDAIVGAAACEDVSGLFPDDPAVNAGIARQKALTLAAGRAASAKKIDQYTAALGGPPLHRAAAIAGYLDDPGPFTDSDFARGSRYSDSCEIFGHCPDTISSGVRPYFALRWLLEQVIGVDTAPWSTAFVANDFLYDSISGSESIVAELLKSPVFNPGGVYSAGDPCATAKARRSHEGSLYAALKEPSDQGFTVFSACQECHVQQESSPSAGYLPFDRPQHLRRFLAANPGLGSDIRRRIHAPLAQERYHMPMGRTLSDAEKAAIDEFLAK